MRYRALADAPLALRIRRHGRAIAIGLALMALAACGPVATKPFTSFSKSVEQLRPNADAALEQVVARSKARFLQGAANDPEKIQGLLLQRVDGDPFGISPEGKVLFRQAASFRDGVDKLNESLAGYADLLADLASPSTIGADRFDKNAQDLNDNTTAALKALKVDVPDNGVAIFSTAAMAIARGYLQSQQRHELIQVITENQGAIDQVSGLGEQAVVTIAVSLRNEYEHSSADLARQLADGENLRPNERTALVADMVSLNDEFVTEMATLRSLHRAYGKLPSAHRQLAQGLQDDKLDLTDIRALVDEGRELGRLYNKLRKSGGAPDTP